MVLFLWLPEVKYHLMESCACTLDVSPPVYIASYRMVDLDEVPKLQRERLAWVLHCL